MKIELLVDAPDSTAWSEAGGRFESTQQIPSSTVYTEFLPFNNEDWMMESNRICTIMNQSFRVK
jgi:hypothetical protein